MASIISTKQTIVQCTLFVRRNKDCDLFVDYDVISDKLKHVIQKKQSELISVKPNQCCLNESLN